MRHNPRHAIRTAEGAFPPQLPGSSWTVTAGTPLALSSVDVPIGQTRRLTLTVTPSSGAVEGLSGTVNYKTP